MSAKSYRFIMEPVFGKGVGDVSGPFHTDGRVIVPEEKAVDQIGGSEYAIFVGKVRKGIFKIARKFRVLPSIVIRTENLIVNSDVASVFGSFRVGDEIGVLPVGLVIMTP